MHVIMGIIFSETTSIAVCYELRNAAADGECHNRFYYDAVSGTCQKFCGGSSLEGNNFETELKCTDTCVTGGGC